ncbi:unnamed protein product [Paramecium sonneborni]|uniref:AAA+ ATPase domain-containing protein n=1 Tax=Paramecium sonneborni TaxID=65129 RepID=A0A8S1KN63_9CILI|nr:unnamed protein product [Paramecium sonneborni]
MPQNQCKMEFLSSQDLRAKIFAYEKIKYGCEYIIKYEEQLKSKMSQSQLKLDIEDYKNQFNKFNQLQFIQNFNATNEIGDFIKLDCIQVNEKPNVRDDSILIVESIRSILKEVALPFKFPQLFANSYHIFDKILLYGPPNSGKKYLVEYCASITNSTFINLSISQLIKKQFDKPIGYFQQIFNYALKMQPCIILLQDLDQLRNQNLSINRNNMNIITELLIVLDKLKSAAFPQFQVIGITSYPWKLEPSVRRRFSKRIYIPFPNNEQIQEFLKQKFSNMKNNLTLVQFEKLANLLEGYTSCDIFNILQQAYENVENDRKQEMKIQQQYQEPILKNVDILDVLKKYKQTTSQDYIKKCLDWKATFD